MRKSLVFRIVFTLLIFFGSRVALREVNNTSNTQNVQQEVPPPPVTAEYTATPRTLKNLPTNQIEVLIHEKINDYRQTQGLPPFKLDYRITDESRKYSAKMASGEASFSHDGFESRIASLEKQALEYESAAENLALLQGYEDLATVAVEGWIDSPGHHKNIIGDFDLTGVGVVKNEEGVYYFTQLFLKRQAR